MKTCEKCGNEIGTKDGENQCQPCDKGQRRKERARDARKAREAALRSLGLTKAKGALGGTYWE